MTEDPNIGKRTYEGVPNPDDHSSNETPSTSAPSTWHKSCVGKYFEYDLSRRIGRNAFCGRGEGWYEPWGFKKAGVDWVWSATR